MYKRSVLLGTAISLLFGLGAVTPAAAYAAGQCQADVTDALEKVGETRLRVYFFRVYDATLYTDSGQYPAAESVALELSYLRNIQAQQLVDTTRDEWESLGFKIDAQAEGWLDELQAMWPDVGQGDCLIAASDNYQQVRFYNQQGELGSIDNAQFAEQFFAIWLSENSSFRRNRDELVGAR